ncbi:glutamate cyclase domain-containing protein [Salinigranum sp. GCM10025319]|uniref:glutamate cyclase domain-containing protein n=1 Tax=Salinigranum sp. GCM10025319 TaxID=3252687 RepID=UPI003613345F
MVQAGKDIATVIDDLTTTDIGGRDTIYPISGAARERQGNAASMQAAEHLVDAVDAGDTVLVLTGFLIPPTMVQETDGPLGAVSVARAVDAALGANPILACEPAALDICKATATAGELSVLDRDTAANSRRTVAVEEFPADRGAAEAYVDDLLDEVDPAAVVAVEKVAPNAEGVYHNMAGYDVSEETAKVDVLYDRLPDDVLTVSVGDAGNEVGMGLVQDVVIDEIEYGAQCQCGCGGGIASDIETDLLVPATVSNWGGHAIAACLSHLTETPVLHTPEVERRMLEQAAAAGSIDGIVGGTNAWCDGLPPDAHEALLRLIHEVLGSSVHSRGGGELGR